MCRIVDPASEGLKGAWEPYGLGMPMSSGMYALGRGSHAVFIMEAGSVRKACLSSALWTSASDRSSRSLSLASKSFAESSVGASP